MISIVLLLLNGCTGPAGSAPRNEAVDKKELGPMRAIPVWELHWNEPRVVASGVVSFEPTPSDEVFVAVHCSWEDARYEARRSGDCMFDVAEMAFFIEGGRNYYTMSALSTSIRPMHLDGCGEPKVADGELSLGWRPLGRLDDLPGACKPVRVSDVLPELTMNRPDRLSEVVELNYSEDRTALRATVTNGDVVAVGKALWIGERPTMEAWNLGRLIALGCAYREFSNDEMGVSQVRLADIVSRIDVELLLHKPLSAVELGVRGDVTPAQAQREFGVLESASQVTNWWRCE